MFGKLQTNLKAGLRVENFVTRNDRFVRAADGA